MKIYAVKDRLIEYFMQPFIGQTDKQVLAALAAAINNKEQTSAISAAPHHFEIWELGEVDEESGRITPKLGLVADCSSLVRADIRERETNEPGIRANGQAPGGGRTAPGATGSPASA